MQHDVLPGSDNWMRFNDRSYRTLAPHPENNRVWGELTLSPPRLHGATAFVLDSSTHPESFHLFYAGDAGITLSRDHRLNEVDLVRRNGALALAGCYFVDMLHAADILSTEEHIVENGRQLIPLAGVADLEPSALLGTSSRSLLRVPLEAILSDTPAPTPLSCDDHAQHFTVPGPVTAPPMNADQLLPPPQCLDPSVHHLRDETAPPCDESEVSLTQPTYHAPSPALLERLSTDLRSSLLQTWKLAGTHARNLVLFARPCLDPGRHVPVWRTPGFSDVFSKSSTDFGSCSFLPFEISVPPNSCPVTSRP